MNKYPTGPAPITHTDRTGLGLQPSQTHRVGSAIKAEELEAPPGFTRMNPYELFLSPFLMVSYGFFDTHLPGRINTDQLVTEADFSRKPFHELFESELSTRPIPRLSCGSVVF